MALDLFGEIPRRPKRVLMHVFDAGGNHDGGDPDYEVIARFECTRCGGKTDWLQIENVTTAKRGIPCEACNAPETLKAHE